MATLSLSGLESLLGGLGLEIPIPQFSAANVLNKPLDICRSYLADILRSLVEGDPVIAYNSIQWPNNIFNGDLVVILPRLSHGADPNALAFDLIEKVWHIIYCYVV
jgi:arginyl-tRNA synthetase